MNVNAQAYDNYKRATVETAAPGKLLLMLFDGAIRNIDNAQKAINDKDVNAAHNLIVKTQNIVLELIASLNMEYEISNNLFSLYEYLYYQLVQANAGKDIGKLNEVRGFLAQFRDTWEEVMKKAAVATREKSEESVQRTLNIKG
ncbi:flagellar export chaperone FliS [Syntrophomonas curvata]